MYFYIQNHYLNKIVVLFFISTPCLVFAQIETYEIKILGKIHNKNTPIESAHIINTSNRKNTISNAKGEFELLASVNDTLEIRCLAFAFKTIVVSQENIAHKTIEIQLTKRVNELREVSISSNGLSGDLEKDLQSIPYTIIDPSKKLGMQFFDGIPQEKIPTVMQTFGFDKEALKRLEVVPVIKIEPLYKHISGYYKKLKGKRKHLGEVDTVDRLVYFYGAPFLVSTYKIAPDSLYNFLFFCVETDESLATKFENKNYDQVLSIFNEKALEFNQ